LLAQLELPDLANRWQTILGSWELAPSILAQLVA
jgi:hypothetical protein